MRKSRFTEAQIIGMIKEQESGMPTAEVCRKHGLSQVEFQFLHGLDWRKTRSRGLCNCRRRGPGQRGVLCRASKV